jgi:hypothetical protein
MSKRHWEWQDCYLETFLDTNPLNLVGRIAAAEKAIFLRTEELRTSSGGEVERQAIADAVRGLAILMKVRPSLQLESKTERRS